MDEVRNTGTKGSVEEVIRWMKFSSRRVKSDVAGFDIPTDWLSAGAAAMMATLNDEHMVQLPFAALATVPSLAWGCKRPAVERGDWLPENFVRGIQPLVDIALICPVAGRRVIDFLK